MSEKNWNNCRSHRVCFKRHQLNQPVAHAVDATAGRCSDSGQRLCDLETPIGFAEDLLGDYTTDVEPALLCLSWPGSHSPGALPASASTSGSSLLTGVSLCARCCAASWPPGTA